MPKQKKELSALEVKRIQDPGRHPVGGVSGLHLRVYQSGARCWVLRTRRGGKRRDYGLGGFPSVTLSQARERAREVLAKLDQGQCPIAERMEREAAIRAAEAKRMTFSQAAHNCHAAKTAEFRNEKHKNDWINSLARYASPVIGDLPVADIELPHVLKVLEPIWHERTETATRVRQRIESVLTWATVSGYREGDNPARWEGNLKEVLPAPNKIRKVKHYRALPWKEVPDFMAALRKREGMAALALEFLILTAARSGEIRGAAWDEIDLAARTWTVPGERIKAGRPHCVPLSVDAVAVLNRVPRMEGSNLIFTAPRGGQLSDMTLTAVLRRMDVDATVHGFRSSFKDWARTCSSYPDEVSELALAHVNSDSTRAAYARDGLFPQRAQLMSAWAKFCREGLPEQATVTPIREAAI